MRLQEIKKACNAQGQYAIFNCPDGQQWICNGAAAWPVEGITITAGSVPAIFDLSPKQQAEMSIREGEVSDERFSVTPMEGEEALRELGDVLFHGVIYRALESAAGLILINREWIKPAARATDDLIFTLRAPEGKAPMVAVYADMFCSGLIMPIHQKGVKQIQEEMGRMLMGHVRRIGKDDEDEAEAGEQTSMEDNAE